MSNYGFIFCRNIDVQSFVKQTLHNRIIYILSRCTYWKLNWADFINLFITLSQAVTYDLDRCYYTGNMAFWQTRNENSKIQSTGTYFKQVSFNIKLLKYLFHHYVTEFLLMNFMDEKISGAHVVLTINISHLYAFNSCWNQQLQQVQK